MPRQQNTSLRFVLADQHRRRSLVNRLEDIRIRDAFLNLTQGFERGRAAVPFRSAFDNAARNECPTEPKGLDLRDFLRALMTAAANTESQATVDATKLYVSRFLGEIQAQAFAVAPMSATPSLADATVCAARETSEALAAIAEAGTTRNPTAIERAVKESDEAVAHISAFRMSAMATLLRRPIGGHAS
jgi:hypothetical protein